MNFGRRRRTDEETHALHVANRRITELTRELAEAKETIRNLGAKADRYRGRNRELIAQVDALMAARRRVS